MIAKTQNSEVEVYFNERQIEFANAPQKVRVWVAGRGSGKSAGLALVLRLMLEELPRAKVLFGSTTLEQLRNSTLSPILEKLEELGIIENIHYVIGQKPPAHFALPWSRPKEYDNVITFFNGFTIVLISTIKPVGKRGGSYDAAIIDEAAFVKAITFRQVLVPMVRGNRFKYKSNLHHAIMLVTSQPTKGDGHYVLEFEKEYLADPTKVFFMWTSAKDNALVLGAEWFEMMKKTMGYGSYLSEIENVRRRTLPNSFYPKFKREKHGYQPTYDNYNRMDDVRLNDLIELTFDFGGHFNCCSVWQEHAGTEYCRRRYHTKDNEGKYKGVVEKIIEDFSGHHLKLARLWGEPRGADDNPYSDDDIYTSIAKMLREKGWEVIEAVKVVQGGKQAKRQRERHFMFDVIFAETRPDLPRLRFNSVATEDVILSIEGAGILPDYQKDKQTEKQEGFPQEHSTHYTDGMDNYITQKYWWKYTNEVNDRPGTVETM